MSTIIRRKFAADESQNQKVGLPVTLPWKNARMIRTHSIKATVQEILNIAKSTGAVQVNICAIPGQGKSTLAKLIAHLTHTMADAPFTVKLWGRKELLNIEEEIKKLDPVNHVILYDDVSWLMADKDVPRQKVDQIIKTMTEIRHIKGVDVQIISILNFHYSYAIPKPLRNAQYWFYLSIGSSELDNVLKLVGTKYQRIVDEFRKVHSEAQNFKVFHYRLGAYGKKFKYDYRMPFAPAIFWNNDTLRHVVFPSREWLAPVCDVCMKGLGIMTKTDEGFDKFQDFITSKFGIGVIRQAFRVLLLQRGINTYQPDVVQCMRLIVDYFQHRAFDPELIAARFGLHETNTKNQNSLPDEILTKDEILKRQKARQYKKEYYQQNKDKIIAQVKAAQELKKKAASEQVEDHTP